MPSPGLSTIMILGEIVLIETILIILYLIYLYLKSKKKILKLNDLLESFLKDEKNRLDILSSMFHKSELIDEEKYTAALKSIIEKENLFYKYLITVLYHNDLKSLDSLSSEIQEIIKPCVELIPINKEIDAEEAEDSPEVNVDDVMDELLSDDEPKIESDPALDLSESVDDTLITENEPLIETTLETDEIAEIPSDLLNSADLPIENEIEAKDSTEEDTFDDSNKPNESHQEK